MPEVRKAVIADALSVAGCLASAFGDDPVFRWMSGLQDTEQRMMPFWRHLVRTGLSRPDHEIFVSADNTSAAVWRGIDQWKLPTGDVVRSLPTMAMALRLRLPVALQILSAMEKSHPTAPHYYLEFLGTRRDRQGHGAGTSVMAPMLERCDAEGVGAYLESSNPRNVPFYARHGFEETGVIAAPKDGPKLITMWREPRN